MSSHNHLHIGELGKPELVFLDHLIFEDQVAAVGRGGHGDAQRHARTRRQVGRQTESLICVPGVVAGPTACICEMDAQVHRVGTRSRPNLAASVGNRDAVGLGLIGTPASGSDTHAVRGHPRWSNDEGRGSGMAETAT